MVYENWEFSSKAEVEDILGIGTSDAIVRAIVGAVNGIDDWVWLQDLCWKYTDHPDFWVANAAIRGLGDIARLHKTLDEAKIMENFNKISSVRLQSSIKDALEDIEIFLR
ncbi:hypothetical protein [Flavobacterium subsaxonicum]|uniref:hypothetical protein n=1 Tax=Flavobacterium subsaxonicum TaxID=426226 RepID=UPI0004132E12|nr:hypothetical protein [Flavobacterium subsaxonicum]